MVYFNICIDIILYGQPLLPKCKLRIPTLKDEIIRKIKRDIMDEFATKPVAKRLIISLKVCDSFPFIRVCKTIKYIMYSYHHFNRNAFLVLSRWLKGHRNMIHQVMVLHKLYRVYYCELGMCDKIWFAFSGTHLDEKTKCFMGNSKLLKIMSRWCISMLTMCHLIQ